MILISQQQVDAELQIIYAALDRLRSGAGLSANAPEVVGYLGKSKKTARCGKGKLNRETAIFIGKYLGRPDFINYIKFN